MNLSHVIEQFGYKPNEAKVYLASLSLGEATSSDIAKKVKLPRTSVQLIIDKLHLDGVMNFYIKRRYKYWIAEDPEKFLENAREKQEAFLAILPQLKSLKKKMEDKPTVKVYSGVHEIKLIFDDVLETRHPIYAIIPWESWIDLLGKEFMDDFIERRVHHNLRISLLAPYSTMVGEMKERDDKELRHTRYLPERIDINDTILIYGSKVAIISLNKALPTGILIDDSNTNKTMGVLFEEVWSQSA